MDLPILSRATHEELIKSHTLLMEAYVNASKTPQVKQSLEEVAQGNALGNVDTPVLGSWHTLLKLVDSDFPLVRFWYKTSWKTHNKGKKDTTRLEASSGQQGSTCAAQGENVNLLFIENANGTPITGTLAAEMREHTRSIWRGLHKKNAALEKWGNASNKIHEQYYYEMESKFYPLCLCDNHWKSQAIATGIYSKWYGYFVKKRKAATTVKVEEKSDKWATKRLRFDTPLDTLKPTSTHNNVTEDVACIPEPIKPKPKPKPIRPIDPLYSLHSHLTQVDTVTNCITEQTFSIPQIQHHLPSTTMCLKILISHLIQTTACPLHRLPLAHWHHP